MTTNTNTRTPARFFASATPNDEGLYTITDRTDDSVVVTIKGRTHARFFAARLSEFDPSPRVELVPEPKSAKKAKAKGTEREARKAALEAEASKAVRQSHADCSHASTKLARAICRRDRAKAAQA
jgi:hypothetical protein